MGSNYGFVSTSFYRGLEWLWHFVYVQMLFLFSTLIGLGLFGFFPALYSTHSVMERFVKGDKQFSIFKVFVQSYKQHFFVANGYGFLFMLGVYILTFNFNYLKIATGLEHTFLSVGWVIGAALFIVVSLYLFPTRILTEAKGKALIKNSIILALGAPISFILLVASVGVLGLVLYMIPGLIPFLSITPFSFLLMGQLHVVVDRMIRKQAAWEEENSGEEKASSLNTLPSYLKEKTS